MLVIYIFLLIAVVVVSVVLMVSINNKKRKTVKVPQKLAVERKLNSLLTASYFINLDRQHERREYMEAQFKDHGIDCRRFSAFDKKLLSDTKLNEMKMNNVLHKNYNPRPNNGSIACLISHVNLYKQIYEEYDGGIFLVFEDDCKILPDFSEKLNNYLERLPEEWDMIWLGYNKIKGERYDDNFYIPLSGNNIGYNSQHHCYLLHYNFIPKIIEILLPLTSNFKTKDKKLRYNFDKFKAFFLRERLAVQDMQHFPISERTGRKNG